MARETINDIIAEADQAQSRIKEIYQIVTDEVTEDESLAGLVSPSKTADFNLWKMIMSAISYIQEQIWGTYKKDIIARAEETIAGTDLWLQLEVQKFQFGDALQVNNQTGKYYYPVIDLTKRIIKRCAVISSGGLTRIKVATENESGEPIALETEQLAALTVFVKKGIQWAGTNILDPISISSDKVNIPMTVYYDGTVPLDSIKEIVEPAFLAYFKRLNFNGEYKLSTHQDAVQDADRAKIYDVVIGAAQGKPDAGVYVPINRVYFPFSGYIEADPAIGLDVMITYIAQ